MQLLAQQDAQLLMKQKELAIKKQELFGNYPMEATEQKKSFKQNLIQKKQNLDQKYNVMSDIQYLVFIVGLLCVLALHQSSYLLSAGLAGAICMLLIVLYIAKGKNLFVIPFLLIATGICVRYILAII